MYSDENYPNFFRVVPSEAAFNPAMVSLLKHFNWTRVGSLYQTNPRHSLVGGIEASFVLGDEESGKVSCKTGAEKKSSLPSLGKICEVREISGTKHSGEHRGN